MNTYYAQRMNFGPKFVFGDESSVCVFSGVGDVSPKRFSKMELLFFLSDLLNFYNVQLLLFRSKGFFSFIYFTYFFNIHYS